MAPFSFCGVYMTYIAIYLFIGFIVSAINEVYQATGAYYKPSTNRFLARIALWPAIILTPFTKGSEWK